MKKNIKVFFSFICTVMLSITLSSNINAALNDTISATFADTNMAQAVANKISGGDTSHVISQSDIDNTTSISLGQNNITNASGIGVFKNLKSLYLQNNLMTDLPSDINQLNVLENLYLHDNKIVFLSSDIGTLTNLKNLDIGINPLDHLPVEIGNLLSLEELHATDTHKLSSIPSEIGKLTKLKYLYIHDNKLEYLPIELNKLTNLVVLASGNNLLKNIPEISSLNKLSSLQLYGNQFETLPTELVNYLNSGASVSLNSLLLSENKIMNLPIYQYDLVKSINSYSLHSQKFNKESPSSYARKTYNLLTLPIFDQLPSFNSGSIISFKLLKPSGETIAITPLVSNGKITLDKTYLIEVGTYTLITSVNGGSLNLSEYRHSFTLNKSIPEITLKKPMKPIVEKSNPYIEPGFTATDIVDGTLTDKVVITGKVNVNKVGIYTLSYTVTNSFNETAKTTRLVEVVSSKSDKNKSLPSTGNNNVVLSIVLLLISVSGVTYIKNRNNL